MEKCICEICGKEFSKIGLAKHYAKIHNHDRKKISTDYEDIYNAGFLLLTTS